MVAALNWRSLWTHVFFSTTATLVCGVVSTEFRGWSSTKARLCGTLPLIVVDIFGPDSLKDGVKLMAQNHSFNSSCPVIAPPLHMKPLVWKAAFVDVIRRRWRSLRCFLRSRCRPSSPITDPCPPWTSRRCPLRDGKVTPPLTRWTSWLRHRWPSKELCCRSTQELIVRSTRSSCDVFLIFTWRSRFTPLTRFLLQKVWPACAAVSRDLTCGLFNREEGG